MKRQQRNDKFLWGAATAAHQVEGHQHNSWSVWEQSHIDDWIKVAERRYRGLPNWERIKSDVCSRDNYNSTIAADHYNRYREDIGIMKEIGLNSYRFSIEWSRIEPERDEFSQEGIEHYREKLKSLREDGLEPFVSLHHLTDPVWLEDTGGWRGKDFPALFTRYAEKMVEELGDLVTFWVTFNEPESYLIARYLGAPVWPGWPHQDFNPLHYLQARRRSIQAHVAAYRAIKSVAPDAQISYTHSVVWLETWSWWLKPIKLVIDSMLGVRKYRAHQAEQDFLGVQYYSGGVVRPKLAHPRTWVDTDTVISDFGWPVYPDGLHHITQALKRYGKPIYITENGIADSADTKRADFIRDHVAAVRRSIDDGADIRGYFYWSLLDNYEWSTGYWPQFGLVHVDRETQARTIRGSAYAYRRIIEAAQSSPDSSS